MDYDVIWSPAALEDVESLAEYIQGAGFVGIILTPMDVVARRLSARRPKKHSGFIAD